MTMSLRPVSPAEIHDELRRIWESLETTKITRASLFNLIFYTQKNHRNAYFSKIAQKVIERFPSRVIFISADKNAKEDFLKTEVSILTSSKGEFDVACDYIHLEAGGASLVRIPFIILPHILPDLPVYLVWAEDPSQDDPLADPLEQLAQRIIFDSEVTENLPRFANGVLAHHQTSQCDIADLNWARIESARDMLSMAFYTEEKLKQIERTRSIEIVYNAQESAFFCHTRIQAIYLQAWLSCQLNWQFKTLRIEKERMIFCYQSPFSPVEVAITAALYPNLPPGLILSLKMETTEQQRFSFERDLNNIHQITLQASTREQCALPSHYIFSKAESGHSLVKEICHRGTSEHYLKVLNLIKTMDTAGLC